MSLSFFLLAGSTLVLIAWGVWDLCEKHWRDGIFLILIGLFDGVAAWDSHRETAAIQAQLAPRHFTPSQAERFQEVFLKFSEVGPHHVLLLVNGAAESHVRSEMKDLAEDLRRAFVGVNGWSAEIKEVEWATNDPDPIGIRLEGERAACQVIGLAFKVAGVLVQVPYSEQEGKGVTIVVGRRLPP